VVVQASSFLNKALMQKATSPPLALQFPPESVVSGHLVAGRVMCQRSWNAVPIALVHFRYYACGGLHMLKPFAHMRCNQWAFLLLHAFMSVNGHSTPLKLKAGNSYIFLPRSSIGCPSSCQHGGDSNTSIVKLSKMTVQGLAA